jgi:DNA recombination-dependent growth factor C
MKIIDDVVEAIDWLFKALEEVQGQRYQLARDLETERLQHARTRELLGRAFTERDQLAARVEHLESYVATVAGGEA